MNLYKTERVWDLQGLVSLWESSTDESWPWVWCSHNPLGPHHVFVGVSNQTLELTKLICESNVRNNLTVVISSIDELDKHKISAKELYKNRCAIIEVPVSQVDAQNTYVER